METLLKAILQAPIPTILIVGGIAFFLIAFFRKVGKTEINQKPNIWALVVGIGLLLFGIGLLYSTSSPKTDNFPFKATVYDFENLTNETDISPLFTVPSSKSYKAIASKDFAHSGKYSLRLFVDMQSAATNPDTEYTGIGLKGKVPLQAKAIVVWMLIPPSEPVQNIVFKAHLLAYKKNDTDTFTTFMSEEARVKPGDWTPFFIGTFGETDKASGHLVWNGKIDELYLTIWSDKSYNGSIYIDDFSIYE